MSISSYVVETHPQKFAQVKAALECLEGVEIHASDGVKLVVTIESPTVDFAYETATALSKIAGITTTNLIYHNFEDEMLGVEGSGVAGATSKSGGAVRGVGAGDDGRVAHTKAVSDRLAGDAR